MRVLAHRWPKRIIYGALIGYVMIAAYMAVAQRQFLYLPAPAWMEPSAHNLPQAKRIELKADDGTALVGWWIPPQREDAPVFLYFHGNANGLDRRAGRFGLMSADGSGVLALSYRGYGSSGGSPSEAAIHADARRAYRHLRESIPANRIVIFGESLGSGVALNLARHVEAKAVILDSPYLSVLARGQSNYPWLPVSWLLVDTFRSDVWIGEVEEPILILHGTVDRVIPPHESAKLATLGKAGRVTRIVYPGEPHVVPYNRGPDRDIPTFLAKIQK